MSTTSKIEWTDSTLNPIRARHKETGKVGWHCTKPSTGCKGCYAEAMNRWRGTGLPFVPASKGKIDVFLDLKVLEKPLHWKKPRKIFMCDMTDLFHEDVSDDDIGAVFTMMANAQWIKGHRFQVLTKRPERMKRIVESIGATIAEQAKGRDNGDGTRSYALHFSFPLNNIWLGVSIEDRKSLSRLDALRDTPATIRFVSLEPLLEDLGRVDLTGIHWVIVGGESGPGARPGDVAWIRSIVAQCQAAGVACFVKQLGSQPRGICDWELHESEPPQWLDEHGTSQLVSEQGPFDLCHAINDFWWPCKPKLNDKKGGDPAEWPEDLRVREFPR